MGVSKNKIEGKKNLKRGAIFSGGVFFLKGFNYMIMNKCVLKGGFFFLLHMWHCVAWLHLKDIKMERSV